MFTQDYIYNIWPHIYLIFAAVLGWIILLDLIYKTLEVVLCTGLEKAVLNIKETFTSYRNRNKCAEKVLFYGTTFQTHFVTGKHLQHNIYGLYS